MPTNRLGPALARAGGAARIGDLADVPPSELTRGLRRGRVTAGAGRVIARPDASPVLIAARAVGGIAVELSAAALWGLPVLTAPTRHQIAVPRNTSRRQLRGVQVLRRDLPETDVAADLPATTPLRTVVDCALRHPLRDALVVANGAAFLRLVTPDDVVRAARQRRGVPVARVLQVARLMDARCESGLETLAMLIYRGLPVPYELQVVLPGVGAVDALIDGRLVSEVDGFAYHSDRDDFLRDRRRAQAIARLGLGLVRFAFEDLFAQADRVEVTILRVLGALRPR